MVGGTGRRSARAGPACLRIPAVVLTAAAVLAGCGASVRGPRGVVVLTPPFPGAPARMMALATARGPAAPATTAAATATCPAGTTVTGGGIATTLIGGGTPPSSLHADGSAPAGAAGKPPTNSGGVPAGWSALGATGGQIVLGGATTAVALCLRGTLGGRPPAVVIAAVPGPAVAATTATATATCPAGGSLLGGGGYATVSRGSASPSLHLIGSYPSDAHGSPVTAGSARPGSWSALADAGGRTGSGVETIAFAVCVPSTGLRTTVALAAKPGPLPAGSATTATAGCPAPSVLIGGGARSGPATGAPQQGLHLTGSFPSDPDGRPAWSAAGAEVSAWSARSESGGQGSPPGTLTTAFAVCLRR